jgi:hypothetical protein
MKLVVDQAWNAYLDRFPDVIFEMILSFFDQFVFAHNYSKLKNQFKGTKFSDNQDPLKERILDQFLNAIDIPAQEYCYQYILNDIVCYRSYYKLYNCIATSYHFPGSFYDRWGGVFVQADRTDDAYNIWCITEFRDTDQKYLQSYVLKYSDSDLRSGTIPFSSMTLTYSTHLSISKLVNLKIIDKHDLGVTNKPVKSIPEMDDIENYDWSVRP